MKKFINLLNLNFLTTPKNQNLFSTNFYRVNNLLGFGIIYYSIVSVFVIKPDKIDSIDK